MPEMSDEVSDMSDLSDVSDEVSNEVSDVCRMVGVGSVGCVGQHHLRGLQKTSSPKVWRVGIGSCEALERKNEKMHSRR